MKGRRVVVTFGPGFMVMSGRTGLGFRMGRPRALLVLCCWKAVSGKGLGEGSKGLRRLLSQAYFGSGGG